MYRGLCLLGAFFLFTASANIYADDPRPVDLIPGLRGRALILDINARVLERDQEVIWNETHRRVAIPGSPVGLKLVGSNVVVAV